MKMKRKNYTCIRLTDHEEYLLDSYLEHTSSGQKSVEIRKIFLSFLDDYFKTPLK
jgi:hypothetical protein